MNIYYQSNLQFVNLSQNKLWNFFRSYDKAWISGIIFGLISCLYNLKSQSKNFCNNAENIISPIDAVPLKKGHVCIYNQYNSDNCSFNFSILNLI